MVVVVVVTTNVAACWKNVETTNALIAASPEVPRGCEVWDGWALFLIVSRL